MDPIEKAIRAALEKGNPEHGVFREKIYASAQSALVRSLSANANLDAPQKQVRLQHLANIVRSIESEFTPAVAPPAAAERPEHVPLPSLKAYIQRQQAPTSEQTKYVQPRVNHDTKSSNFGTRHNLDISPSDRKASNTQYTDEQDKPTASIFRKLVKVFVVLTFLALIVMLSWALWSTSLFGNGTNVGSGPAAVTGENLSSGPAQDENWITIFEPKDAASVQVSDGVAAELRGTGSSQSLSISNLKAGKSGEASFEIGKGILETLRGKKIVFNIRAKTTDGATSQMAASCSLAGLGECQRVRFRLEGQVAENLVIVQLADSAPEASGTLTVQPDIDQTGNPVEIVAIMVRAEP